MAGCRGAVGCLLSCLWLVTSSGENVTSRLVVDYVQFYGHHDVYVLDPGEGGGSWAADTFLALATLRDTFVGVVSLASPGVRRGWPRHNIDPLMVAMLTTPHHAATLSRVFPLVPTRCSWMLLLPTPHLTTWLHLLTLPLDSRVTVATLSPEGSSASFWQVYQITSDMDKRMLPAGRWLSTPEADLDLSGFRSEVLPRDRVEERRVTFGRMVAVVGDPLLRRTDLSGLHLTCTTVNEPPHTFLNATKDGTVSVTGIFGDIFATLQEITNFTCSCRPSRDKQWGALKGGRWTGMVGDVVEGVADMAVASLDITAERSAVVDFLLPISHTRYKMVVKRPISSDQMSGTYTKEFSSCVWAVLGTTAVVLVLALHATTTAMEDQRERMSFLNSFTVAMGALCGQGCSTPPRTGPARLVLLTTLMLHVVIQAHYTSNLASSLAVGPLMPSFSTIQGAQAVPGLSFGLMRQTALVEYLKSSGNPHHQAAFRRVMAEENLLVGTTAEGVAKTLQENYVYMDTDLYIYYNVDCRHYVLSGAEFRAFTSMAITKDSPLTPVLNSVLLRMKAGGLVKKIETSWVSHSEECDQTAPSPIRLAAITTPLLGLLLAAALSTSCCAFEVLINAKASRSHHATLPNEDKAGHGYSGK